MRSSLGFVVVALALSTQHEARADSFHNVARGVIVDAAFATSAAGDAIMGEVGGESLGIRISCDGRWVMQWDALLAIKGGVLGNTHPYIFLIGPRALAWIEGGYLFHHNTASAFHGYVGARVSGTVQLLGNPDVSRFDQINEADGTGGASARGAARVSAGSAWIRKDAAFFATLFAQEELQAPTTNFPSYAFTEMGLSLRFDVAQNIMATLEALYGVTPSSTDSLRGFTDQTTRIGASGSFRKLFKNGVWLGLTASIERDSDHIVSTTAQVSDTTNAPVFSAALALGIPLGWGRGP